MTRHESERLKIGERIYQTEDRVWGTVFDIGYHGLAVRWDDGQTGTVSHADADSISKEQAA